VAGSPPWRSESCAIRSCGISGEYSGIGVGFLQALRFSLPINLPTVPPSSSSIIRAGIIGHIMAGVPSGLTLSQEMRKVLWNGVVL
jgi:hypothetical protein